MWDAYMRLYFVEYNIASEFSKYIVAGFSSITDQGAEPTTYVLKGNFSGFDFCESRFDKDGSDVVYGCCSTIVQKRYGDMLTHYLDIPTDTDIGWSRSLVSSWTEKRYIM